MTNGQRLIKRKENMVIIRKGKEYDMTKGKRNYFERL